MRLQDLIKELKPEKVIGKTDLIIADVVKDCSAVTEDSLFIAIKGESSDGHDYVKNAESYGAVAVICERELDVGITQIIVKDSRIAMCITASVFYGHPERKLSVVGVTGTNGKTTTAFMIYSVLNAENIPCGFIGTIGVYYGDTVKEPTLTTPDPINLYSTFAEMADHGVKTVVMEVSAHAVYFNKIYGVRFKVGVFTNFSQDHLDFFKSMEEYKKQKIRFFTDYKPKCSVINSDDEVGREILKKAGNCVTYGLYNPADVFAIKIKEKKDGLSFVLNLFDNVYEIKTKVYGKFNAYNVMACATACLFLGLSVEALAKRLFELKTVDGRIEKVYDGDYSVYVDYAHTPDGLKKVLSALKKISDGNVISLFGCGGNRDKDKREKMGEISGRYSDFTVITSDNPRYEDPMDIIFDIEKGVLKETKKYVLIQDRKEAIKYAISLANKGDIVLIAGKGAEKYQEVLGVKRPYNDKEAVKEIVATLK